MKESYIDEQGMESFYRDFNEKGKELLEKYDHMQSALDEGASGIRGLTQSSLNDASTQIATIRQKLEDILLRYNNCMSNSIDSMSGLDADSASRMKGELANMSEGIKKRSGGGGGSSGGSSGGGTGGGSGGGSTPVTEPKPDDSSKKPFKPNDDSKPDDSSKKPFKPNDDSKTDDSSKKPFKPNDDSNKKRSGGDDNNGNSKKIDDELKRLQEKIRQLEEENRQKHQGENGKDGTSGNQGRDGKDGTSGNQGRDGKDGTSGNQGRDGKDGKDYYGGNGNNNNNNGGGSGGGSSQIPSYTPSTGNIPSTGTNFGPNENGSGTTGTGSDLGTTSRDKDDLGKMSTGNEEENPNLENGEVIEEGKLSDVAPSDDLSDGNLELGATDDNLVPEDKKGNNNLLKFAGIGGMLLGSGALAAGLATKKDEEELSAEEETGDELEDEYSQELKDFYE